MYVNLIKPTKKIWDMNKEYFFTRKEKERCISGNDNKIGEKRNESKSSKVSLWSTSP